MRWRLNRVDAVGIERKVTMKNKLVKNIMYPINLQIFAEDGAGGAEEGTDGAGGSEEEEDEEEDDKGPSFDEFLSNPTNQSEFDKRIDKAIKKAVSKAQEKWKAEHDENLSEAEKLAKMSKDEKAKYLFDKEKKEFEDEKNKFAKEKLEVEVIKQLQGEKLPVAFSTSLVEMGDAEAISNAIKEIKAEWDKQLNEAIKDRARERTPRDGSSIGGKRESMRDIAAKARIIK